MYDPERLRFYMERRIETTMIGALARIEENLGYLWGHNKDGDLTEKEEEFADVWEFTRNEILNHGNQQMRNLKEDFHKYGGVFKNQYNYTFKVNNNNQNRKDN